MTVNTNGQSLAAKASRTADRVPIYNASTPVDEIVAGLGEVGGCIIKDFVSSEIIKKLNSDFDPLLAAEQERWSGKYNQQGNRDSRQTTVPGLNHTP